MLHAKFQDRQTSGSEVDSQNFFTDMGIADMGIPLNVKMPTKDGN